MSKKWLAAVVAVAIIGAVAATSNLATALKDDAKAATAKSETMMSTRYLVISPHTQEECLAALDGTVAMGKDALMNWEWGCMSGDHTGYAFMNVGTEEDALKSVPETVRAKARAIKLSRFTAEQIKAFHEMH